MLLSEIKQHLETVIDCPDWSVGCVHQEQEESIAILGIPRLFPGTLQQNQSYGEKTIALIVRSNSEVKAEETAQKIYTYFFDQPQQIKDKSIVQCILGSDTPINVEPLPAHGIVYRIEVQIIYRKGDK